MWRPRRAAGQGKETVRRCGSIGAATDVEAYAVADSVSVVGQVWRHPLPRVELPRGLRPRIA